MKLHVDLETLQLIEGPGFRSPASTLRFKRGDSAKLEVVFLQNGTTPVEIGDPDSLELQFGVKPRSRYDVGYLVHASDWTLPSAGAASPSYLCSPNFNTEELNSALQVGSSTGTELSEVLLMGEITWREGTGEPTSTRTFLLAVENDVNRGTEGVPVSATSAYPHPDAIELLANRNTAGGYAGLDTEGRVSISRIEETPPGMLRAISIKDSGSMSVVVKSANGFATIRWWDGTTESGGTGSISSNISFSKAVPSTGPWARSTPKEILVWSSNNVGIQSPHGLTYVYLVNAGLTSLDVCQLASLDNLNCASNNLASLDVSACTALTTLSCYQNQLAELDVSALTSLEILNCAYNQLTRLDPSGCPLLLALNCEDNQIEELDLRGLDNLSELYCSRNAITALDAAGLGSLTRLYASNNQLGALEVPDGAPLTQVAANDNPLLTVSFPGGIAGINHHWTAPESAWFANCLLPAAQLDAIYTVLGDINAFNYSNLVDVTGNPGAGAGSGTNPGIATAKGWIVVGDTV